MVVYNGIFRTRIGRREKHMSKGFLWVFFIFGLCNSGSKSKGIMILSHFMKHQKNRSLWKHGSRLSPHFTNHPGLHRWWDRFIPGWENRIRFTQIQIYLMSPWQYVAHFGWWFSYNLIRFKSKSMYQVMIEQFILKVYYLLWSLEPPIWKGFLLETSWLIDPLQAKVVRSIGLLGVVLSAWKALDFGCCCCCCCCCRLHGIFVRLRTSAPIWGTGCRAANQRAFAVLWGEGGHVWQCSNVGTHGEVHVWTGQLTKP